MKSRLGWLPFVLGLVMLTSCNDGGGDPGVNLNIDGPANDTILWQAFQLSELICCPTCATAGVVTIPNNGLRVSVTHVLDNAVYFAHDNSGCMAIASLPGCGPNAPVFLSCARQPSPAAQGTITLSGSVASTTITIYETVCGPDPDGLCVRQPVQETVWNTGSVSVSINGQTATASVGANSTAASVAGALAYAIDTNSVLSPQLMAVPEGARVLVHAKQTGTQYNYPWQASCTYNSAQFSSCSINASLSPASALVTQ
jgi:hypothetical protein